LVYCNKLRDINNDIKQVLDEEKYEYMTTLHGYLNSLKVKELKELITELGHNYDKKKNKHDNCNIIIMNLQEYTELEKFYEYIFDKFGETKHTTTMRNCIKETYDTDMKNECLDLYKRFCKLCVYTSRLQHINELLKNKL